MMVDAICLFRFLFYSSFKKKDRMVIDTLQSAKLICKGAKNGTKGL